MWMTWGDDACVRDQKRDSTVRFIKNRRTYSHDELFKKPLVTGTASDFW